MEKTLTKVVLIGAAGTLGQKILDALLGCPTALSITLLTRQASFSSLPNHSSITVVRTDYTLSQLTTLFTEQDAVISAGSLATLPLERTLIEAAARAGVKRFVLNYFINAPSQPGLEQLEPFRKVKLDLVTFAEQVAESSKGNFTWTAIATGNFIDLSVIRYPEFGFDLGQRKARLVDGGNTKITACTMSDIGVAVAGILTNPAKTATRFVRIRSVQTTQQELLAALERFLPVSSEGKKEWTVEHVASKDLYERGRILYQSDGKAEKRKGMLDLLVTQIWGETETPRSIVVSKEDSDNKVVGVVEKTPDELVAAIVESYTA